MSADAKSLRALWHPRAPELTVQCASCPFRKGNNAEFGAVLNRIRTKAGMKGECSKRDVGKARLQVMVDVMDRGDFICHGTAYDAQMNQRPVTEFRQCPGATKFHRGKL